MDQQYVIRLSYTKKSKGYIDDTQGRRVTYFASDKRFFQVKLSGPPIGPIVGPSVLEEGEFILNVQWSEPEQARWESHKQSHDRSLPTSQEGGHSQENAEHKNAEHKNAQDVQPDHRYTKSEKQWLKIHYGDEFHLLRDFGLSIYKDEDREEGRTILRKIMADEEFVPAIPNKPANTKDYDTEDEFEGSDEDVEGHMADWHFDKESLDWIKKHYGNAVKFMFSFGLKFYLKEDGAEARSIVQALASKDDDSE
ncbi:MAG: hypothetical protein Q9160_002969 [Pyrenula sp. 1 TL-2023]